MTETLSQQLFQRAAAVIPGGVNSPVRAFRSVGGDPLFIRSARGSRLVDVDGREYIDYVGSWGPMLFGHADPEVVEAIREVVGRGTSFGAPTELEIELAEEIIDAVPSVEMVRLVSSGTEAVMSALRLARGYTGRDVIVKFDGCYHGHSDGLLAQAGSGLATLGIPDCPGVPAAFTALTRSLPFNDLDAIEALFRKEGDSIAAVIVEPVAGNMGCIAPRPGFLEGLREVTHRHGSLLVFDEVMTGFRLARGGAQERYGIAPDLTTLGKVVGGGMPLAAYGGRREILLHLAPAGPVYQAGTLSGNPVAVTAGLVQLRKIKQHPPYDQLESAGGYLAAGLSDAATAAGIATRTNRVGSMFTSFFTGSEVHSYEDAKTSDTQRFGRFFRGMLERGIYLAPSQFEAAFLSLAHTREDLDLTLAAARETLQAVA